MTFSLFREADGPLLGSVSLCRSNVKVFVDRDKEGEAGRKEGGRVPFLAAGQRAVLLPAEHRGRKEGAD